MVPRSRGCPLRRVRAARLHLPLPALVILSLWCALVSLHFTAARAADVRGYSVIKGQFLLQTSPSELITDSLFGWSILASVDLADFDLLTEASVQLPDGESLPADNLGDYWSILDSFDSVEELDEAYPWGDYRLSFSAVNDGDFTCEVSLPASEFPPAPRLTNFEDINAVNASQPLTLTWDFDLPPSPGDFVQIYVNLGHDEVWSTPGLGEPGALTSADRTTTIPADTLFSGYIHSLNLEITRVVSTNADCHPQAQGVGALFRSTELDLLVLAPPEVRWLPRTTNGEFDLEVTAAPEQPVILQASENLTSWSVIATNAEASGTNVFRIVPGELSHRYFRAMIQ
jgi:hypothetical protein